MPTTIVTNHWNAAPLIKQSLKLSNSEFINFIIFMVNRRMLWYFIFASYLRVLLCIFRLKCNIIQRIPYLRGSCIYFYSFASAIFLVGGPQVTGSWVVGGSKRFLFSMFNLLNSSLTSIIFLLSCQLTGWCWLLFFNRNGTNYALVKYPLQINYASQ